MLSQVKFTIVIGCLQKLQNLHGFQEFPLNIHVKCEPSFILLFSPSRFVIDNNFFSLNIVQIIGTCVLCINLGIITTFLCIKMRP